MQTSSHVGPYCPCVFSNYGNIAHDEIILHGCPSV